MTEVEIYLHIVLIEAFEGMPVGALDAYPEFNVYQIEFCVPEQCVRSVRCTSSTIADCSSIYRR